MINTASQKLSHVAHYLAQIVVPWLVLTNGIVYYLLAIPVFYAYKPQT